LAAVELDNEASLTADKVDAIKAGRLWADEFVSAELPVASLSISMP
jgi:hypothetical protein